MYIHKMYENQEAPGLMAKDKSKNKTSQLVIRLEKAERDAFVDLCASMDTTAAREIRHFMRKFVAKHTKAPKGKDKSKG